MKYEPVPTPEMLQWHDMEVGLFFHYDIEVFQPEWNYHNPAVPPASCWNPVKLDTDQWIRTAVAAGARYALLTAKHGTGFCLWPTKQHGYHVGNSSVKRDVVGEFVTSCRRYGIKPGLYYSLGGAYPERMFTGPDNTLDREGLNQMLLAQVEELITGYGPLCEIWFDGGIRRPEKGGPDIPSLMNRIAPEMICFGGCPGLRNILRWSGSEQGVAVKECWSTAHFLQEPERNNVTCDSIGDPDDPVWAPVEVDLPSRDVLKAYMGGWMYHDKEEQTTFSGEGFFSRYLTSVGRNANLLIGCVPDSNGLISTDQRNAFADFGVRVKASFGTPMEGRRKEKEDAVEIYFENPVDIAYAEIMEDQSLGQHILEWKLEIRWPKEWIDEQKREVWIPVDEGQSIGHKRIVQLNCLRADAIRIHITKAKEGARIRSFKVFGKEVYCCRQAV